VTVYPERIVCLTEETTEILYLLGEGHRVVGISGYTLRPPEARDKPKVSSFISAKYDKISALSPDLVLTFSDLQADITAELVRRGFTVHAFNQRSVDEILQAIRTLAGLVGRQRAGEELADTLSAGLERIRESAARLPFRPRVFFEEWNEPLISGIQWVEELIEIAGGTSVFPELRHMRLAKDRIVDPQEVLRRNPEVVLASWCGKRVNRASIRGRPGWDGMSAVRNGDIYEIPSTYILQPGPAALTEGIHRIHERLKDIVRRPTPPQLSTG